MPKRSEAHSEKIRAGIAARKQAGKPVGRPRNTNGADIVRGTPLPPMSLAALIRRANALGKELAAVQMRIADHFE